MYRVSDVRFGDCAPSNAHGFQKWASQVNTFFHRRAKDGIRYNRTNLRIFTEIDDQEYAFEQQSFDKRIPDFITECATLDEFFAKVNFDYPSKTWKDQKEWAMKLKLTRHEGGGVSAEFVNPPMRR